MLTLSESIDYVFWQRPVTSENHKIKSLAQFWSLLWENVYHYMGCLGRCAIQQEPDNSLLYTYVVKKDLLSSFIGDDLINVVFETVQTKDDARPKSAPRSNFLWIPDDN